MNIEKTKWAKEFKIDCLSYYDKAIELVSNPDLMVDIDYNNENGNWVHAVRIADNEDFWLDAKKTKKQAEALCHKMNWKIKQ